MAKPAHPQLAKLFEAILLLDTPEACGAFFEDLCTVNELQAMASRWEVARLLGQKVTYQEVAQKTGASTATISRVNRCLHYGADGYAQMLKRLEEKRDG